MSSAPTVSVEIREADFDPSAEMEALAGRPGAAGAVVTFLGLCRDEAGRLACLELEHYPGMAEEEIGRVVAEAASRWPLLSVRVIHRFGRMAPGDRIVFVGTSSSHRDAAFAGASFIMDFLKTSAPFWKREHLKDGSLGAWVEAKETDEKAAEAWRRPD